MIHYFGNFLLLISSLAFFEASAFAIVPGGFFVAKNDFRFSVGDIDKTSICMKTIFGIFFTSMVEQVIHQPRTNTEYPGCPQTYLCDGENVQIVFFSLEKIRINELVVGIAKV